jgi:hypothetical protein
MDSQSFLVFLQSECLAIAALVDELGDREISSEEEECINLNMIRQISRHPGLQGYFDGDLCDSEGNRGDKISTATTTTTNMSQSRPWSRSLRLTIVDHLITLDINISLLIDVVESYRFEAAIEELVEIVRSLDILGAENRLSEYEALLYMKLKETSNDGLKWEEICGERLPVSFLKKFSFYETSSAVIGTVGSQRLIEYFLANMHSSKERIFWKLCQSGHILVAQWLYGLGGLDNPVIQDSFCCACYSSGPMVI